MPELKFIKELPSRVPSELNVYSTERVRYGRDAVLNISRKFKLPDIIYRYHPEFRYVDNWNIMKSGVYTVAINRRSGAMRFRDEVRHGRELDATFNITKLRLTNIAREFIDKTKLLKQPARDLKVGKITYMRTRGSPTEGEMTPEQILDAGVIFTREIDEVPVVGFGGYTMVNVAHDESVVAVEKIWRHRDEKIGKVKILKPDYAVEELNKRLNRRKIKGKVKVLKADFCYFEASDNTIQRYLEPTYAFLFETKVGEFIYKSVEVIPAISEPKQKWIFRKRFPAPPIVRKK